MLTSRCQLLTRLRHVFRVIPRSNCAYSRRTNVKISATPFLPTETHRCLLSREFDCHSSLYSIDTRPNGPPCDPSSSSEGASLVCRRKLVYNSLRHDNFGPLSPSSMNGSRPKFFSGGRCRKGTYPPLPSARKRSSSPPAPPVSFLSLNLPPQSEFAPTPIFMILLLMKMTWHSLTVWTEEKKEPSPGTR